MSLKRTLAKIEIEERRILRSTEELASAWVLGLAIVLPAVLTSTCDKKDKHRDYNKPKQNMQLNYQETPSLAYSGKEYKIIW